MADSPVLYLWLAAILLGLLPLLFESRGFYGLGVVLLPLAIAESGLVAPCAALLGLN